MFVPGKLHGGVHLLHDLMWHMFATTMCTCKWSCVQAGSWLSKRPLLHAVILRWHFSVIYFKILWLCRLRLYFWGSFHIQIWWNWSGTAVKMTTECLFMSIWLGAVWKTISFQVSTFCLYTFHSYLRCFPPIHPLRPIDYMLIKKPVNVISALPRCGPLIVWLRLMVWYSNWVPCDQPLFVLLLKFKACWLCIPFLCDIMETLGLIIYRSEISLACF